MQQAYEIQVSNLTRSVAHLEENLRQSEDDKQNILADLTAVRELCSRLEATKETLQRQLTSAQLDREQVTRRRYIFIWDHIYIVVLSNCRHQGNTAEAAHVRSARQGTGNS